MVVADPARAHSWVAADAAYPGMLTGATPDGTGNPSDALTADPPTYTVSTTPESADIPHLRTSDLKPENTASTTDSSAPATETKSQYEHFLAQKGTCI